MAESLQSSIFLDLLVADRAVGELLRQAFVDQELTPLEYGLLSTVAMTPGITATQLATQMAAPLTTMTDWLARPVRAGLIERRRSDADGRAWELALTPAGERAFAAARRAFGEVYEQYLAHADVDADEQHRALAAIATAARDVARAVAARDAR